MDLSIGLDVDGATIRAKEHDRKDYWYGLLLQANPVRVTHAAIRE